MRQAKRGQVGLGGTGARLVRRRRRFDSASALLSLLSKQTWCLTSTETIRLIRDGEKGEGYGGGVRGRLYTYRYKRRHNQNDSCIKTGSDESHFNVSVIVRNRVTRRCPQTTTFKGKERRSGFEPRSFCTSLTPHRR